MKTTQILIAGFGGQGALFAGKFLAYKGLVQDKQVSWLPSYGPEMRGGTANCSVIISDTPVGSPIITNPDVLVAMNLPSLQKFVNDVVPGGIIILDSTLIGAKVDREDVKVCYVPATQMARDAGFPTLANMILTGKVLKETACVDFADNKGTLGAFIPAKKAGTADGLRFLSLIIKSTPEKECFLFAVQSTATRFSTRPSSINRSKSFFDYSQTTDLRRKGYIGEGGSKPGQYERSYQ